VTPTVTAHAQPRKADDHSVKLFRKSSSLDELPPPSFGQWLLGKFMSTEPVDALPGFAQLEQACSSAASLLCGAVIARPDAFRGHAALDADTQREAALVAKRTADGFRASLADRTNVVLAWPWDHLATRVAWRATQGENESLRVMGDELLRIGESYGLAHREQLEAVIALWEQVALCLPSGREVHLAEMGGQMHAAYELEVGGPVSSQAAG